MNHLLIDNIAKTNEVRTGQAAAQQAITDALIVTLLQAYPHLLENLGTHLGELAAAERMHLAHEGASAKTAFDTRIHSTLGLLDALKGC